MEQYWLKNKFEDLKNKDLAGLDFAHLWDERCKAQDEMTGASFDELNSLIEYYLRIMVELKRRFPNDYPDKT